MKKLTLALFLILFASTGFACGYHCDCPSTDGLVTDNALDNAQEDATRMSAISTSMASLELDPTRDGFSMGVALGVANFADGDDEFGEAIGLMYGRDDKAVNFKYGRSGSYSAAGVGITVGF